MLDALSNKHFECLKEHKKLDEHFVQTQRRDLSMPLVRKFLTSQLQDRVNGHIEIDLINLASRAQNEGMPDEKIAEELAAISEKRIDFGLGEHDNNFIEQIAEKLQKGTLSDGDLQAALNRFNAFAKDKQNASEVLAIKKQCLAIIHVQINESKENDPRVVHLMKEMKFVAVLVLEALNAV
jgi:uncharacterized protein with von Willebrand factor type A (vWA) domain